MLTSRDGERWESAALLSEAGIDLRDPKLSVTPDNRLMLAMGGSVYEGKKLVGRQPRVAFSKDGHAWTTPRRVLEEGDWLWRVTWHKGHAYGIAYRSTSRNAATSSAAADWSVRLFESTDGITYRLVTPLAVTGQPNEATVRFLKNGDCVALVRREGPGEDRAAWIGQSSPPYRDWQWRSAGMQIGGPNFIVLPGGKMIASGRQYGGKTTSNKTFVGRMSLDAVKRSCSCPAAVIAAIRAWCGTMDCSGWLYYSSHEGKSAIYLAKVQWPGM